MYKSFEGTKFRPTGDMVFSGKYDAQDRPIYKEEFTITKSYSIYCYEKRVHDAELKVYVKRQQIEYTQRVYGEVDQVDVDELISLIKDLELVKTKR